MQATFYPTGIWAKTLAEASIHSNKLLCYICYLLAKTLLVLVVHNEMFLILIHTFITSRLFTILILIHLKIRLKIKCHVTTDQIYLLTPEFYYSQRTSNHASTRFFLQRKFSSQFTFFNIFSLANKLTTADILVRSYRQSIQRVLHGTLALDLRCLVPKLAIKCNQLEHGQLSQLSM